MTLIKKMSIGVLIMLFLIFIGTYLITMNNSRNFFMEQIENNAQDTATSLGLSLSQFVLSNDEATVKAMVQAVFDRGYFSFIEVQDIKGNVIVSKTSRIQQGDVPSWFIRLIQWPPIKKSSLIMNGWRQAGVVFVTGNPVYGYTSLWSNAVKMSKAYLLFALISLLLVYAFIRFLLKPLQKIRAQALAISEHQFIIEHHLPKTPELRQVTMAMNQMSIMVRSLFQDQLQQINTLRQEVYEDSLTGLSNRRYFSQQLAALLENQDEFVPGFIVMVVIDGLQKINQQQGFQQGDKLIIAVAHLCKEFWHSPKVSTIARISGSTIAFITHETDHETFINECKKFEHILKGVIAEYPECSIHIGATEYVLHQSSSNALTIVDSAVNKAREQGVFYCQKEKGQFTFLNAITVQDIKRSLIDKSMRLFGQAVTDEHQILHTEVFVRLYDQQGQELGARHFISLAEQLKVAHLIDSYVLDEIANKKRIGSFALNLSEDTLTHVKHSKHYLAQLKKLPKTVLKNLALEIKESLVLSHFEAIKDFILEAKKYGVKIGIDKVGTHFSPLYYLNDLPINYLKLDGCLIKNIEENKSKQFFIHYFNKMAKTMNIQVVATQVETSIQWETLKMADISWGQGRYLAHIIPLDES